MLALNGGKRPPRQDQSENTDRDHSDAKHWLSGAVSKF